MENETIIITSATAAEQTIRPYIQGLDHEEVWGIFLKASGAILCIEKLSMGTLTQTSIDCRTVIRKALLLNAMGFVLVHNHPSGDPRPSVHDINFTDRLYKACSLMDIKLLDHIVIGENGYISFSDEIINKF